MKTKQISQVWNFMKIMIVFVSVAFLFAVVANWSRKQNQKQWDKERSEMQSYHKAQFETIGQNEILIVKR